MIVHAEAHVRLMCEAVMAHDQGAAHSAIYEKRRAVPHHRFMIVHSFMSVCAIMNAHTETRRSSEAHVRIKTVCDAHV